MHCHPILTPQALETWGVGGYEPHEEPSFPLSQNSQASLSSQRWRIWRSNKLALVFYALFLKTLFMGLRLTHHAPENVVSCSYVLLGPNSSGWSRATWILHKITIVKKLVCFLASCFETQPERSSTFPASTRSRNALYPGTHFFFSGIALNISITVRHLSPIRCET